MARFLFLPGLVGNFRISEANADYIQAQIDDAVANGTTVHVPVEMGDDPLNQPSVTINGAALPWFVIATAPDPAVQG